ncbi:MAG: hypothetical protein ACQET3_00865 [Promethearchaeati archaeon]
MVEEKLKERLDEAVKTLIKLLEGTEPPGHPLDIVKTELEKQLVSDFENSSSIAEKAIEYALNQWLVEKIPAHPSAETGLPVEKHTWFLHPLDEAESKSLAGLSKKEKAFLRLLYSSESEEGIGIVREDDAIQALREQGYEIDNLPWVKEKKMDVFYTRENGNMVRWYYIKPWVERTQEYQKGVEESSEMAWKKELLIMKEDNKNHFKKDGAQKD